MTVSISDAATECARARDAMEATAVAYDTFTSGHDYERWVATIESLARQHGLVAQGELLDVGCGTGKSFLPWLARGWAVTACDFSPAMLEHAAAKAPSARLFEADARDLGTLGAFQLVQLLDDVINMVPAGDLPAVFSSVQRNLSPDGVVVFDANTLRTFRTFFGETHVQEVDDCVVTWRGSASADLPPGEAAEASMDVFVRDDGAWHRSGGVHREYHHPLTVIEHALATAGLELVAVHGQDESCNVSAEPDELVHSKVLLIARRAAAQRFALRETVEAFPAGDGAIYFLRGGGDAEHVLTEPSATARRVLEQLHAEQTLEELHADGERSEVDALLASLGSHGLLKRTPNGVQRLPARFRERYDRQLLYFAAETRDDEAAAAAQRALMDAAVCIVGCGGLGSWTAVALAGAGIGRLVLVDDDTVESSNLNRQLLFRHADIGRAKVEAAGDAIRAQNPDVAVEPVDERITGPDDVVRAARGADLVVEVADSPPYAITRWISAATRALGVPHLVAAQLPPLVRVGPLFVPGVTGCARCQEHAARREYPEYDALVAYRERHDRTAAALAPLCGLIGSILAMEVVHFVTGVATPATRGQAIVIDARDLSVATEEVVREDECDACGGAGPTASSGAP